MTFCQIGFRSVRSSSSFVKLFPSDRMSDFWDENNDGRRKAVWHYISICSSSIIFRFLCSTSANFPGAEIILFCSSSVLLLHPRTIFQCPRYRECQSVRCSFGCCLSSHLLGVTPPVNNKHAAMQWNGNYTERNLFVFVVCDCPWCEIKHALLLNLTFPFK